MAGERDFSRLLLLKISFKIYVLQLFGTACQFVLGIPQSLSSSTSVGCCSLVSLGFLLFVNFWIALVHQKATLNGLLLQHHLQMYLEKLARNANTLMDTS